MDSGLGFVQAVLAAAVDQGAPLLLVALGEIISERAGVLNLGAEGMMLMGAVCGFAACGAGSSLLAGVAAAMLAGGLFSLAHAVLSVTFRANQIVSGLALSILGLGLSSFIGERMDLILQPAALGFIAIEIFFLSRLPFLGPALFRQNLLAYAAYALAPATWFFLFRTRLGLCIRAVGESPATADVTGVRVAAVRYLCVTLGGILAGLGGAYLSLALSPGWKEQMTAGRGWVALALVIFGAWHPGRAALGALLFGALYSLDTRMQARGTVIPVQFLQMIPYIGTIVFLSVAQRGSSRRAASAPEALGRPYFREEKE